MCLLRRNCSILQFNGRQESIKLSFGKPGWTHLLKQEGTEFLTWIRDKRTLSLKFEVMSAALAAILCERIRTPEQARDVWKAVPAVLCCCNEQATYEMRGAAEAYAWLAYA